MARGVAFLLAPGLGKTQREIAEDCGAVAFLRAFGAWRVAEGRDRNKVPARAFPPPVQHGPSGPPQREFFWEQAGRVGNPEKRPLYRTPPVPHGPSRRAPPYVGHIISIHKGSQ